MYLQKDEILEYIDRKALFIRPLLDQNQIGENTIDFRLGYDFLVSIQGRQPYIDTSLNDEDEGSRRLENFFHTTRRRPGETFLLHPSQTILATSLEYIKLPDDVMLILNMRSSYSRMGLTLSTIVQPGYCGCISIELTNVNKNSINLTVGSRLFQARAVKMPKTSNYFSSRRKYLCQVRPQISAVGKDSDLQVLKNYYNSLNNIS